MNIPINDLLILLGLWFFLGAAAGMIVGHHLAARDEEPIPVLRFTTKERTHLRVLAGEGSRSCSLYDYENDPPWGAA